MKKTTVVSQQLFTQLVISIEDQKEVKGGTDTIIIEDLSEF